MKKLNTGKKTKNSHKPRGSWRSKEQPFEAIKNAFLDPPANSSL
jgi:hypothetical protein